MPSSHINTTGHRGARFLAAVLAAAGWAGILAAGPDEGRERSGEELYNGACLPCHGPDGRGQSREVTGFDQELPDFSDCTFGNREADTDWISVIRSGGPARFEPHDTELTEPEQVQIYEDIMGDPEGRVTTGLLTATQYLKDNRLLPEGFDKASAPEEVAVRGRARDDGDFDGGGDTVLYRFPLYESVGPWKVTVRLLYQPIGFRWAQNLGARPALETDRFLRFWEDVAPVSRQTLAEAVLALPAPVAVATETANAFGSSFVDRAPERITPLMKP
ncbi:MAG: cytochrome c [Deltaproteobacteria bacterium]|nr:cytochrome c [Deltaproteobacteria bacterium]